MTNDPSAGQPRASGKYAHRVQGTSDVALDAAPASDIHYQADYAGTFKLTTNAYEKPLPEWPEELAEPSVYFEFDDGKVQTHIDIDGSPTMRFWTDDMEGTMDSTDHGGSPWEDLDEDDADQAMEWGKAVHERIDSAAYSASIDIAHEPKVNAVILAYATGKPPAPTTEKPTAAAFKDTAARHAYVAQRYFDLREQARDMETVCLGAVTESLIEKFPKLDGFILDRDNGNGWVERAWDKEGNGYSEAGLEEMGDIFYKHVEYDELDTLRSDDDERSVSDIMGYIPKY